MPKETNRGPNPQLRLQSWAFSPPAVPLLLPDLAHVRRQTAVDAPLNLWRNQRVTQLQQVSKRIRFRSHKRSNAYVHTLCIHIAMLAAIRMLNAEQDARSIGKEAALCTNVCYGLSANLCRNVFQRQQGGHPPDVVRCSALQYSCNSLRLDKNPARLGM